MSLAAVSLQPWLSNAAQILNSIICFLVFLIFDLLDAVFCVFFRFLDEYIEGEASPCCCADDGGGRKVKDDGLSESVYERKNIFRGMRFLKTRSDSNEECEKTGGSSMKNRWSDCGCESCLSWMNDDGDYRLHFVVKEPSNCMHDGEKCRGRASENVIFLHGFMSSSSFWTETVFPCFSEKVNQDYRLIAIDLLGFGKSPKPRDCNYTLKEHVEIIERSVIQPLQLDTFHLVAHSMGCIIALAIAAKHPTSVKSITLVAPPYSPCEGNDACLKALGKMAGKKLWPPLAFGCSFMSWYEHLGRCICFLYCRNHRIWESTLKFITFNKRDLNFLTIDLPRHTHHSAWSSMHNVICGGAKFMDTYLKILTKAGVIINVIQGGKDEVVPIDCCIDLKKKVPNAEINIIPNKNHKTVVFCREKEFANSLELTWALK
ncbi:hypothetical protein PIB30_025725 [Stylosanthes scabra]|uniref:AB hydrolase-1 domain-containing protein n=1 Tax=Stylosanthes scabra TaxID=79078 RepID=A0ABU6Z6V0_9FABA|nr:hypothetical protein [Stylosanthes scabra]